MSKRLQTIKRKMLADREVRGAYEALGDEFDLAQELIAARARAGLTQAEVAERMGTTQSVVARLESGAQMPSVNTLLKFAKATRSRPIIRLLAAQPSRGRKRWSWEGSWRKTPRGDRNASSAHSTGRRT